MSKKEAVVFAVALAVLAFFAGFAFAAEKTVTGEVVSVEPSAKTLVIHTQGKEMTFRVLEKAARLVGYLFTGFLEERGATFSDPERTARTLANLKPGDRVTVSYTEADGKLYVESVTNG